MRVLRIVLLGIVGLLVFVVVGVVGFWWLGGDDAHRWLARRALDAAFDHPVEVDGGLEVDLGAEPRLRVTGLRIDAPPWAASPTLLRVDRAEVQIALRPLLRGLLLFRRIALDGIAVDLEIAADGRQSWDLDPGSVPDAPAGPGNLALPLIERLSVSDATVTHDDRPNQRVTKVHLASLNDRQDPASGGMRLDAHGDINGNPFRLDGTSGSLEMALTATEPYPVDFEVELPALDGKLTGTVGEVVLGQGIDLRLEARSPSLQAALSAWAVPTTVDAHIEATAVLAGDLNTLGLTDLDAVITNAGGDVVELSGGLANLWDGSGLDGCVVAKLAPAGGFAELFPEDARVLERIDAEALVGGSISAPTFDQIAVEVRGPGGSRFDLAGKLGLTVAEAGPLLADVELISRLAAPAPGVFADQLGFDPSLLGALQGRATLKSVDQGIEAEDFVIEAGGFGQVRIEGGGRVAALDAAGTAVAPDLALSVTMADSAPLLDLIDEEIPTLGQLEASGRFRQDGQGYRFDDLEIDLGSTDGPTLSAAGSVGPLVADATGLDLKIRFALPAVEALRSLLPPDVPELGMIEGDVGLAGTIADLRIADARIQSSSNGGVTVTASGGIASLRAAEPVALDGVAFALEARAPTTMAAARLFGHEVPELGPVQVNADLTDDQGAIALRAIRLVAGAPTEPTVAITGAIGDLLAFQQVRLESDLKIPTAALLAFVDIHGKADIGRVHGKVHLSDAAGAVGIEHLEAEIKETHLLSLRVEGLIDDLENLDQVKFETSLEIANVADLADGFDAGGAGLEAFRFDGKLSGDQRGFDADGRAVLGTTQVDGKLAGDFSSVRPSFKGRLGSPRMRLADFGATPIVLDDQAPTPEVSAGPAPPLFDDQPLPLDELGQFDLDLDVQIDNVEGIALAIDRVTARVTLDDGLLRLTPLRFAFGGGYAEADADLDTGRPTPTWRVHAEADDVDLGDVLGQLEAEVPLRGDLDLLLDLDATGRSPRDLAASLGGDLNIALQRGQIDSRLLGLTTMNPLRWAIARSTRRGYSTIDCFLVNLHAESGVAETRALVLDTPNVVATGEGNIDFARETIDLRISPQAKQSRLVEFATPFAISGDLANPSVRASAVGGAARAVGRVALGPVNLLGSLLPFVNDRGGDQANPCLAVADPEAASP